MSKFVKLSDVKQTLLEMSKEKTKPVGWGDVLMERLKDLSIEVSEDCISRQQAIDVVYKAYTPDDAIRAVPPANIPQGEWIPCTKEGLALTELMRREGKKWYGYRCTNCSFIYKGNALTESRYCQWCGAKMKG